jgi:hypothetical protein
MVGQFGVGVGVPQILQQNGSHITHPAMLMAEAVDGGGDAKPLAIASAKSLA